MPQILTLKSNTLLAARSSQCFLYLSCILHDVSCKYVPRTNFDASSDPKVLRDNLDPNKALEAFILEAPNKITINCKVDSELEADRIITGLKVTHLLLLDFLPFVSKLSPFVDLFPSQTWFKKSRASSGQ